MSSTEPPIVVWFRQDLRLQDNPALHAASSGGRPVVALFIYAPDEEGAWAPGGAARVWLHGSLQKLSETLTKRGVGLTLRTGDTLDALHDVVRSAGAGGVYWNRRYEPAAIARDTEIKRELNAAYADRAFEARSFKAALLHEPHEIATRAGTPFQVFTPYWRFVQTLPSPAAPLPAPRRVTAPAKAPKSVSLESLGLEPAIHWDDGIKSAWRMGEAGAKRALDAFLDAALLDYAEQRDRPGAVGVSRLAPHLHFGEIGPRQIWHAVRKKSGASTHSKAAAEPYLRQLAWRDFAHSLLYHFPHTTTEPLHVKYASFPWRKTGPEFHAWKRGRTGYPLVDAGMRELWQTGWMHNRVRMVVASFLVKHLLHHWVEGARWFWDTLVDADLANNTMGWQWSAGCGADAAPYFRIFNPVAQGERFDAEGRYVRTYVPELARLPNKWIHRPWQAPPTVLLEAGITLGEHYPEPIVDHAFARKRALDALASIKT